MAERLMSEGRWMDAAHKWSDLGDYRDSRVSSAQAMFDGWVARGADEARQGNIEQAIRSYNSAHRSLDVLQSAGKAKRARNQLTASARMYLSQAFSKHDAMDYLGAIDDCRLALALDHSLVTRAEATYRSAWCRQGTTYMERGRWQDAVKWYQSKFFSTSPNAVHLD
jgi:tetratricopeptide (TPR) repeat protein